MNTKKITGYTPGPWTVQHDKVEGIRPICQLYHPCGDIVDWPTDTPDDGDREAEANAALIAAAPELLAALEVISRTGHISQYLAETDPMALKQVRAAVRAAVAKVKGDK